MSKFISLFRLSLLFTIFFVIAACNSEEDLIDNIDNPPTSIEDFTYGVFDENGDVIERPEGMAVTLVNNLGLLGGVYSLTTSGRGVSSNDVKLPVIDPTSGTVSVATNTPAGSYRVTVTRGDKTEETMIYITVKPADKKNLDKVLETGVGRYGNNADFNYIITTGITDMSGVFNDKTNFNGDISHWNMRQVTNMRNMFSGAGSFNRDISRWDVSKVVDMVGMFSNAHAFNRDISGWKVSGVSDMAGMFYGADSFDHDVSGWDVSEVVDMAGMFNGATTFSQDLEVWYVDEAVSMVAMFTGSGVSSEAGNLPCWYDGNQKKCPKIEDLSYSSVDEKGYVIERPEGVAAVLKNNLLSISGVSYTLSVGGNGDPIDNVKLPVIDPKRGTVSLSADTTAGSYRVVASKGEERGEAMVYVTVKPTSKSDLTAVLETGIGQYGNTGDFNYIITSEITDMRILFYESRNFNGDISRWDVSKTTIMDTMFYGARAFNQDISRWAISQVTDMSYMFAGAWSFNQNISNWDVSNVTTMYGMFWSAKGYSQNLEAWNVPSTVDKTHMFFDSSVSAEAGNLPCWYDDLQNKCTTIGDFSYNVVGEDGYVIERLPIDKVLTNDLGSAKGVIYTLSASGKGSNFNHVVMPTIDSTTGAVTMTADTTPGAYRVTATEDRVGEDGVKIYGRKQAMVYVTIKPKTKADLKTALLTGVEQYSKKADFNYILTGEITDMGGLFGDIRGSFNNSFLGDISRWDVSQVTDMSWMFLGVRYFDRDIGGWDVSSVTNMIGMFYGAQEFNQDIGDWDVSKVTSMSWMLSHNYFNRDISGWDVSGVTDMTAMFYSAVDFNQDIGDWDVSRVTGMNGVFQYAKKFNQDISRWKVSNVTTMESMFEEASVFSQDLEGWNVASRVNKNNMFRKSDVSGAKGNLPCWYDVTQSKCPKIGDFSYNAVGEDGYVIERPATAITLTNSVGSMNGVSYTLAASGEGGGFSSVVMPTIDSITGDVSITADTTPGSYIVTATANKVSAVKAKQAPIYITTRPTTKSDLRVVLQIGTGYYGNDADFNYILTGGIDDMGIVFQNNNTFNGDISRWNVSQVTNMFAMFNDATVFDRDLSRWDVSKVVDMGAMFMGANRFNQDISDWNMGNVAKMNFMFHSAHDFDQDIGGWEVSQAIDMSWMFYDAKKFNRDIRNWEVSNVTDMSSIFEGAAGFNQNLEAWHVAGAVTKSKMFDGSRVSAAKGNLPCWYDDTQRKCTVTVTDLSYNTVDDDGYVIERPEGMAATLNNNLGAIIGINYTLTASGQGNQFAEVVMPTIDPTTGEVTISADTTAGSYRVIISKGDEIAETMIYVTVRPTGRVDLNKALQTGIGRYGSTADFNYIITSDITDIECLFVGKLDIYCQYSIYDHRPYLNDFNGNISRWDVSKVVNMQGVFYETTAFNGDIGNWDVSSVTDMWGMFYHAKAFNRDISRWDVSQVTNMRTMFDLATSFDQDIGNWNVSNVTDMKYMFYNAWVFNQDISGWDVSRVTSMKHMFVGAKIFDQDLEAWNVGSGVNKEDMFYASRVSAGSGNLPCWYNRDQDKCTTIGDFNYNVVGEDGYVIEREPAAMTLANGIGAVNGVTYTIDASGKWTDFNNVVIPIIDPTTGVVTIATDTTPGGYVVSANEERFENGVRIIGRKQAVVYVTVKPTTKEDLKTALLTGVEKYSKRADFNYILTGEITDMGSLFADIRGSFNESFLGDISRWDVSKVTDMSAMFLGVRYFDRDIGDWDVSSVTDMSWMFYGAQEFNQDISRWNVSQVINMSGMFSHNYFNRDISRWEVGKVTDMSYMFWNALKFNQDISGWDVSSVSGMGSMFNRASDFSQDLEAWNVASRVYKGDIFKNSSVSTANGNLPCWYNDNQSKCPKIEEFSYSTVSDDGYVIERPQGTAATLNNNVGAFSGISYTLTASGEGPSFNNVKLPTIDPTTGEVTISRDTTAGSYRVVMTKSDKTKEEMIYVTVRPTTKAELSRAIQTGINRYGNTADFNYILTGEITDMGTMFHGNFDGEIDRWDVSQVTDMSGMFLFAEKFNGDISSWKVGNVVDMGDMFHGATAFDQDLESWNVLSDVNKNNMFNNTGVSITAGNLPCWYDGTQDKCPRDRRSQLQYPQ